MWYSEKLGDFFAQHQPERLFFDAAAVEAAAIKAGLTFVPGPFPGVDADYLVLEEPLQVAFTGGWGKLRFVRGFAIKGDLGIVFEHKVLSLEGGEAVYFPVLWYGFIAEASEAMVDGQVPSAILKGLGVQAVPITLPEAVVILPPEESEDDPEDRDIDAEDPTLGFVSEIQTE